MEQTQQEQQMQQKTSPIIPASDVEAACAQVAALSSVVTAQLSRIAELAPQSPSSPKPQALQACEAEPSIQAGIRQACSRTEDTAKDKSIIASAIKVTSEEAEILRETSAAKTGPTSDVLPAMLPPGLTDHWFLSHFQRTGGDAVGMLQVPVAHCYTPLHPKLPAPVPFPSNTA